MRRIKMEEKKKEWIVRDFIEYINSNNLIDQAYDDRLTSLMELQVSLFGKRIVKDVTVQQDLAKALNGKNKKPKRMKDTESEELDERYASTIRLYVPDNIINNVIDEEDSVADI